MKTIRAVDIDFIDSFNESAKACYPNEFTCMVRQENGVINEMILLPGTLYGDSHSSFSEWMSPIDFSIAGTAHSHPGYSNKASDEDILLFANMGGIHFITCQPYDRNSWKAYDSKGEEVVLETIDHI
ncbi:MAG: Mov34/MPN/PAD-1 family protein [archaeon]|nr:Mov34/MPN/PAD-1 family protein [archaeon]